MQESNYLKDDIRNINQLLTIPCLQDVMLKDLSSLLRLSKLRHYLHEECIIREGEKDLWIYFLLSGRVNIVKEEICIGKLESMGELFGEMRIMDGKARSASAFAIGKTICLAVDTSADYRLHSEEDARSLKDLFNRLISKALSRRLRSVNEELVAVKQELAFLKGVESYLIPIESDPQ